MPVAWTLAQRFWPACLLRWDDAGLPRMGLATVLAKCQRIGRSRSGSATSSSSVISEDMLLASRSASTGLSSSPRAQTTDAG